MLEHLDAHERLMARIGLRGTPGILYPDDKGIVQRLSGMPSGNLLEAVLGPR